MRLPSRKRCFPYAWAERYDVDRQPIVDLQREQPLDIHIDHRIGILDSNRSQHIPPVGIVSRRGGKGGGGIGLLNACLSFRNRGLHVRRLETNTLCTHGEISCCIATTKSWVRCSARVACMSATLPLSTLVILVYLLGMVTGGALFGLVRSWIHGATRPPR